MIRARFFRSGVSSVLVLASTVSWSAPAWALRQTGIEEYPEGRRRLAAALQTPFFADPAVPNPAPAGRAAPSFQFAAGAEEPPFGVLLYGSDPDWNKAVRVETSLFKNSPVPLGSPEPTDRVEEADAAQVTVSNSRLLSYPHFRVERMTRNDRAFRNTVTHLHNQVVALFRDKEASEPAVKDLFPPLLIVPVSPAEPVHLKARQGEQLLKNLLIQGKETAIRYQENFPPDGLWRPAKVKIKLEGDRLRVRRAPSLPWEPLPLHEKNFFLVGVQGFLSFYAVSKASESDSLVFQRVRSGIRPGNVEELLGAGAEEGLKTRLADRGSISRHLEELRELAGDRVTKLKLFAEPLQEFTWQGTDSSRVIRAIEDREAGLQFFVTLVPEGSPRAYTLVVQEFTPLRSRTVEDPDSLRRVAVNLSEFARFKGVPVFMAGMRLGTPTRIEQTLRAAIRAYPARVALRFSGRAGAYLVEVPQAGTEEAWKGGPDITIHRQPHRDHSVILYGFDPLVGRAVVEMLGKRSGRAILGFQAFNSEDEIANENIVVFRSEPLRDILGQVLRPEELKIVWDDEKDRVNFEDPRALPLLRDPRVAAGLRRQKEKILRKAMELKKPSEWEGLSMSFKEEESAVLFLTAGDVPDRWGPIAQVTVTKIAAPAGGLPRAILHFTGLPSVEYARTSLYERGPAAGAEEAAERVRAKYGTAPYAIGLRVGGTNISAGLVNEEAEVEIATALPETPWRALPQVLALLGNPSLDQVDARIIELIPTPRHILTDEQRAKAAQIAEEVTAEVVRHIVALIRNTGLPLENFKHIHIAFAGPVDPQTGHVGAPYAAANVPGFENYPLATKVRQGVREALEVDVSTVAENDTPSGRKGEPGADVYGIWGTGMNDDSSVVEMFETGHGLVGEIGSDGKSHYTLHDATQSRPTLGPGQFEVEQRLRGDALIELFFQPNGFADGAQITHAARPDNPDREERDRAIGIIREIGQDYGRSRAALLFPYYRDQRFIPKQYRVGSGVAEKLGKGLVDERGRDLLFQAIQEGAFKELAGRFSAPPADASRIAESIIRSDRDARREMGAAAEGLRAAAGAEEAPQSFKEFNAADSRYRKAIQAAEKFEKPQAPHPANIFWNRWEALRAFRSATKLPWYAKAASQMDALLQENLRRIVFGYQLHFAGRTLHQWNADSDIDRLLSGSPEDAVWMDLFARALSPEEVQRVRDEQHLASILEVAADKARQLPPVRVIVYTPNVVLLRLPDHERLTANLNRIKANAEPGSGTAGRMATQIREVLRQAEMLKERQDRGPSGRSPAPAADAPARLADELTKELLYPIHARNLLPIILRRWATHPSRSKWPEKAVAEFLAERLSHLGQTLPVVQVEADLELAKKIRPRGAAFSKREDVPVFLEELRLILQRTPQWSQQDPWRVANQVIPLIDRHEPLIQQDPAQNDGEGPQLEGLAGAVESAIWRLRDQKPNEPDQAIIGDLWIFFRPQTAGVEEKAWMPQAALSFLEQEARTNGAQFLRVVTDRVSTMPLQPFDKGPMAVWIQRAAELSLTGQVTLTPQASGDKREFEVRPATAWFEKAEGTGQVRRRIHEVLRRPDSSSWDLLLAIIAEQENVLDEVRVEAARALLRVPLAGLPDIERALAAVGALNSHNDNPGRPSRKLSIYDPGSAFSERRVRMGRQLIVVLRELSRFRAEAVAAQPPLTRDQVLERVAPRTGTEPAVGFVLDLDRVLNGGAQQVSDETIALLDRLISQNIQARVLLLTSGDRTLLSRQLAGRLTEAHQREVSVVEVPAGSPKLPALQQWAQQQGGISSYRTLFITGEPESVQSTPWAQSVFPLSEPGRPEPSNWEEVLRAAIALELAKSQFPYLRPAARDHRALIRNAHLEDFIFTAAGTEELDAQIWRNEMDYTLDLFVSAYAETGIRMLALGVAGMIDPHAAVMAVTAEMKSRLLTDWEKRPSTVTVSSETFGEVLTELQLALTRTYWHSDGLNEDIEGSKRSLRSLWTAGMEEAPVVRALREFNGYPSYFLPLDEDRQARTRAVLVNAVEDPRLRHLAQALSVIKSKDNPYELEFRLVIPESRVEETLAELRRINPAAADEFLRARIVSYDEDRGRSAETAQWEALGQLARLYGYPSGFAMQSAGAVRIENELTPRIAVELAAFFQAGGLNFVSAEAIERLQTILEAA